MINFALFGAGRIGKMHAAHIAANPKANLRYVYDVYKPAAQETATQWNAEAVESVEQALQAPDLDAVLISTSTDTHVDLIIRAAKAGKAILCEKPIDLDIAKVNHCWEAIKDCLVSIQIGFNRRFDPSHKAVRDAVHDNEVGRLEEVVITSRDPDLPPLDYMKHSGGLFRDMMIHDFDMVRYVTEEEPVEITAMGSALVDPQVAQLGDIDTAMVLLRMASGALCHINCSRRAVYGYDQRIEAFGSKGMIQSDNQTATSVSRYTCEVTAAREPLLNFFIDRYRDSYRSQMDSFIDALLSGQPVSPSFEDGRRALMLSDAAQESLRSGKTVYLNFETS